MLSLGGGSAYVERIIKAQYPGLEVTVADFEECIALNRGVYDSSGIRAMACNLALPLNLGNFKYDLIMACEVIEHLPRSPGNLLREVARHARKGSGLVVSTPNLGRAENLVKLTLGRPIMAEPDRSFSEATFENEGCHRREYLKCEILALARNAGFGHLKTQYVWNRKPRQRWPFRLVTAAYRRFRPTLLMLFAYEGCS